MRKKTALLIGIVVLVTIAALAVAHDIIEVFQ